MLMRVNERLKKSIYFMQSALDYCLGGVKLNVLPSPRVLEPHILTPCASMIVFAIGLGPVTDPGYQTTAEIPLVAQAF